MSSGDFSNLVIRNITSYNPDGSFVAAGNVFTVGADGKQVWTTDLTLSTLQVVGLTIQSTVRFDNFVANSFVVNSTATVSSLISKNAILGSSVVVSSITTSGLETSTLTGSSIHAVSGVFDSSLTVTSLTVRGDLSVSTLHGSTLMTGSEVIISSLVVGSDITTNTMAFSTITGSSIYTHDLNAVSTISVGSLLTTSSLSTLHNATMGTVTIMSSLSVGSSINTPYAYIPAFIGSSIIADNGIFTSSIMATSSIKTNSMSVASSLYVGGTTAIDGYLTVGSYLNVGSYMNVSSYLNVGSTLQVGGALNVSSAVTALSMTVSTTMLASSLSAKSITITSSLSVGSTITTGSLGYSTLIGSTITTNTINIMSSMVTSSISTNTISSMVLMISSMFDTAGIPVPLGTNGKSGLVCSNLPLAYERLTAYIDRATGKLSFSSPSSFSTLYKVDYFAYDTISSTFIEGYDVPSVSNPVPVQGLQFPVPSSLSLARIGSWCSAYITDLSVYDATWNITAACLRTGLNGNDLYSLNIARVMNSLTITSIPGNPTNISAQLYPVGDPTGILFTFSPPSTTGGFISCYEAYASNSTLLSQIGTSSPILVQGLTAGSLYTLSMLARNPMGQSASIAAAPTTLVYKTKPGAPTSIIPSLYPVGAATGMNISFTYPTNLGGGVDTYYATLSDIYGIQSPVIISSSTSPMYVAPPSIIQSTIYSVSVYAKNAGGQSISSIATSSIQFQVLPTAPVITSYIVFPNATPGILIGFNPPVNNGGGITSYTLRSYNAATSSIVGSVTGTSSPLLVSGMIAGTLYNLSVFATNNAGNGPESSYLSVIYGEPPGAPTLTSLSLDPAGNPTGVVVTYTAPSYLGGGIDYYKATVFNGSTIVSYASTLNGTVAPLKFTGLSAGTLYTFSVIAGNGIAASIPSNTSTIVYKTLPTAPLSVSGSLYPVGATTGINVSFAYPSDLGGGVDSYTVKAYDVSSIQSTVSSTGATSPIYLSTGLVPGSTYRFTTVATNTGGTSSGVSSISNLLYQIPPTAPSIATTTLDPAGNPTGIKVVSVQPTNIGGGINTYTTMAYSSNTLIASSISTISTAFISSLTAGVAYTFKSFATNTGGSGPSSIASAPIVYKTLPSLPTNISGALYPVGAATGINVSFAYPSDLGGGVDSYTVKAYDVSSIQSTVSSTGTGSTFYLSTGLVPGSTYRFTTLATNAGGSTAEATSASNLLYQIPPQMQVSVSASLSTITSPSSINVSFVPSTNSGGGVTSYFAGAYYGSTLTTSVTGLSTSYTFSSMFTAGLTYSIVTNATNTGGTGRSNSTSITYYTKPAAPSSVSGSLRSVGTSTYIDVSFGTSTDSGGGALTYYVMANDVSSIATVSSSGTSSPISLLSGLTVGTTYRFMVYCSNPSVSSFVTSSISNLYYYVIPPAPTSVVPSLYPAGNPSAIQITFNPITTVGGITNYTSYAYYGGSQFTTLTSASTTHYLSSFNLGSTYDIRVNATNPAGTGPLSVSSLLTYYTKPSAPSITSLALDPSTTPSGIMVSFTAPVSTGGGIINYVASAFNGATFVASTINTASPLKVVSLTAGTNYTFSVVAINPGGSTSSVTSTLTYYTQPTAVQSLTATVGPTPGSGKASLTWSAPTSIGGGTMEYQLVAKTTSGGTIAYTSPWITAVSNTASTLIDGTNYTFTVAGRNNIVTTLINYASTNAIPYTTPPAPTGLTALSNYNGYVPLSWNAPSSTPAANNYLITNTTTGGTATTTAVTYNWSGLTNGSSYYFTVAASNNGGANWGPAVGPVGPAKPFIAPSGLSATSGLNGYVRLTWSAPVLSPAANYYLITNTTTGGTVTTTNLTLDWGGLSNGTTYYFTVAASNNNAASWGPATGAVSAIPYTNPNPPTSVATSSVGNTTISLSWSVPSSSNGSAITGYAVYINNTDNGSLSSWAYYSASTFYNTYTGLINFNNYQFTVYAINAAGWSGASTTVSAIPYTTPSIPTFSGVSSAGYGGIVYYTVSGNKYATITVWCDQVGGRPTTTSGSLSSSYTRPYDYWVYGCNTSIGGTIRANATYGGLTSGDAAVGVAFVVGDGEILSGCWY